MTWTIDPRKFADQVRADHRAVCVKAATLVDQVVVNASPFDTGRFRGNWIPTIGASSDAQRGVIDLPGIFAEAKRVFESAPLYPVIYLSNNLPYAQRLNEGHSGQAPAGFVETAVDIAVGVIKRGEL